MPTIPEGRPTLSLIDLDALRWNFRQVRAKVGPDVKILSMVKASGYGHGAARIAEVLAADGSDAFGVATVEEGLELREAGIRAPILVVAGEAARQDIGRMLVQAVEQWCRDQGCGLIEVTSNDRRTAAHAFYRHMGYERTSMRFAKKL